MDPSYYYGGGDEDIDMNFGSEAFLPPPVKNLFSFPSPIKGAKGGKAGAIGGKFSSGYGPSESYGGMDAGGGVDFVLPPLPPIAGKTDRLGGGGGISVVVVNRARVPTGGRTQPSTARMPPRNAGDGGDDGGGGGSGGGGDSSLRSFRSSGHFGSLDSLGSLGSPGCFGPFFFDSLRRSSHSGSLKRR
mmetsp:Transcript_23787/g.58989  ORF Transcript_23787/g.58989 Transcript_23787/m.58989 type:complete len:188 (-) Transcript_23787:1144-1707(-)